MSLLSNNYLSFIFCLFLSTSAFAQPELPRPYIHEAEDGLVYNTAFQYKDYYFSGLVVLKKEENGYHIIMLSKLGVSIVDFVLTINGLIWSKSPRRMDNPVVKSAFQKDFNLLLLTALTQPGKIKPKADGFKFKGGQKIKIKLDEAGRVTQAETKKGLNLIKATSVFYYLDADNIPDEICLTHRFIKMKMEMSLLFN